MVDQQSIVLLRNGTGNMNLLDFWTTYWKATEQERDEYDLSTASTWRMAAAKTKNPEDGDWWFTNGYKFFENWVTWRQDNPQYEIARLQDGEPAIELEMAIDINGVTIKMALDRVFLDKSTDEYILVDIKTGKYTPDSALQLGFYAYGLRKIHGLNVTRGHYWMARRKDLSPALNLAAFSDSKIETLVGMFDKARKSDIFLPNFDHCNMCGLTVHCEWYQRKETNE